MRWRGAVVLPELWIVCALWCAACSAAWGSWALFLAAFIFGVKAINEIPE